MRLVYANENRAVGTAVKGHVMQQEQPQVQQDVQRIMQRAKELGYDPQRVARALTLTPRAEPAQQPAPAKDMSRATG